MTTIAGNIGLGVAAATDIVTADIFGMADKASVHYLFCGHHRKSQNCCFAPLGIDMLLGWTMASLAAALIWGQVTGSDTFEMRVFVKILPNSRVTSATNVVACKAV